MGVLRCGHPITGSRFCPECGVVATHEEQSADPFSGRTIGDRYRVGELINVGGMGRVYKGIQTSLDRPVAIKVIHPHLLTSEEVVGRFFTEARASSRLNHPNVVSIYDFGRMPQSEGGHLFLVMELLSGKDLRVILDDERLPLKRIADILRQTLAALGEAHHLGITHRDVKPENILLETRRGEPQHVKVIDFGIARIGGEARRTVAGRVFGTPWYMAPEQGSGGNVGPSADLYAVGVMLFEMLTGKVPFDDEIPSSVLLKHLTAPRPDPRKIAPDRQIPDDLARVCMRALEIDPQKRYPDAESLAAAIVQTATSEAWSSGKSTLFPKKRETDKQPKSSDPGPFALAQTASLHATDDREALLVGRDEDIAAILELTNKPGDARGLVVHGHSGVGRSRVLRAVLAALHEEKTHTIAIRAVPRPAAEVSLSGLALLVPALTGLGADALAAGPEGVPEQVAQGLATIFKHEVLPERSPEITRRTVDAALSWATRRAVERAGGGRVVVAMDDVDGMDPVTQWALEDHIENDAARDVFFVMTSEQPPELGLATRIRGRELHGLSRADATRLLGDIALPAAAGEEIEPLYVEALQRWRRLETPDEAPATLPALLAAWLKRLPPGQQRTIQALGVAGSGNLRDLAEVLPRAEDLDDALRPLAESGVLDVNGGNVRLRNAIYGRVALASAPSGAVAELHARAATLAGAAPIAAELRAYHAVRGEPSFETFMLVEEAAKARTVLGNDEGTIALLLDGISVAREHELRGEAEAQVAVSARIVFGRKLGDALMRAGRLDQAQGVLGEILELAPPRDAARAHVLERLATIAFHRGRHAEAEQRRAEASMIADYAGDHELAERLRAPVPRIDTRPPRRMILKTPVVGVAARSAPPSVPGRTKRASER